jgi:hypothetical protein
MCNYSENWTVAPLRGLSVDFALLLFWFSKQAIIESGTGATPHGPAGAELAGAGPFPNGRVTDTAALRITEMDFIVRMQDSPWIEILPSMTSLHKPCARTWTHTSRSVTNTSLIRDFRDVEKRK